MKATAKASIKATTTVTKETKEKTIAITGIGGFIGLQLAIHAVAAGYQVRGLELSASAAELAQASGATVITGCVTDESSVKEALTDANIVVHTAAVVAEDGPLKLYEKVNNRGTENVARIAAKLGCRHFIHLSSIMVYGFDYPPNVDESGPFTRDSNPYNTTKLSSEKLAMGYHNQNNMQVTVIRPGDVYGAHSQPWWLRPLAMIKAGQFMLPNGGRGVINHVHIDNLIDGIFLALTQPEKSTGQTFNITDDTATSCKTFFNYHQQAAGRKSLPTLPANIMKAAIWALAKAYRLAGKEPPATAAAVEFLNRKNKISCDKAKDVLGYRPAITLEEGMQAILKENHG